MSACGEQGIGCRSTTRNKSSIWHIRMVFIVVNWTVDASTDQEFGHKCEKRVGFKSHPCRTSRRRLPRGDPKERRGRKAVSRVKSYEWGYPWPSVGGDQFTSGRMRSDRVSEEAGLNQLVSLTFSFDTIKYTYLNVTHHSIATVNRRIIYFA